MQIKTRSIAYAGLLTAISIVLTRFFSAPVYIGGFYSIRLGLGGIPIILSGLLLGPWLGAATGALADLVGMILFPTGGAYFPGFTLSAALSGFIPGFFAAKYPITRSFFKLLGVIAISDVITSLLLNTLWLHITLGTPFLVLLLPRILSRAILVPFYSIVIYGLLKTFSAASIRLKS